MMIFSTPEVDNLVKDLKDKRELMINYLKMKMIEEDWHGVADAAMDIREIEANLKLLDH